MNREIQTIQDVYRHVEAVTVVKLSDHLFSLPDSLIGGRHINEILVHPTTLILFNASNDRPLRAIPRRIYDARGEEISLANGKFPLINIFDESGNLVIRKEFLMRAGDNLKIGYDQWQVVRSFAQAFVNYTIAELCCYPGSRGHPNEMLKLMREEYRDLDWLEDLKGNLAMLREEICKIVRPHTWSYHYVRSNKDGSISIERGFDYRVVKYYEREFADQDAVTHS